MIGDGTTFNQIHATTVIQMKMVRCEVGDDRPMIKAAAFDAEHRTVMGVRQICGQRFKDLLGWDLAFGQQWPTYGCSDTIVGL